MEKVIRDGMVAVLYSPGFGAGWYSWHREEVLIYHPELVRLVEEGRQVEITEEMCQRIIGKNSYNCILGAGALCIKWLPIGEAFQIEEYDGAESIRIRDREDYLIA